MPTPEPATPNFTAQLITLAGGMAAVILSLIAFIAHWFKEVQKDQQGQLTEGLEEFTNLKLENVKLNAEIEALKKWNIAQGKELDHLHKQNAIMLEAIGKIQGNYGRLIPAMKAEFEKLKAAGESRDHKICGLNRELKVHHDFILRVQEKHFHQHGESIPLGGNQ